MEERKLIREAVRGSETAFEMLIDQYRAKIYAICLRLLCDSQDAEDAAQESMLKIFLSLKKFHFKSSFATWVYAVAKNTATDALRRRKPDVSMEELEDNGANLFVGGDLVAEEVGRRELQNTIARLLGSLPAEQRTCLILKDVDGYSCDEIAEITGTSLGTVKSRLHRGRERLSVLIRENGLT